MDALPKLLLVVLLGGLALAPSAFHLGQRVTRIAKGAPVAPLDPFSPWFGFPVVYALVYGLGGLELTAWEEEIPTGDYAIYFAGLAAYFTGALLSHAMPVKIGSGQPPLSRPRLETLLMLGLFFFTFLIGVIVFLQAGNPLLAADFENARTKVVVEVGGWAYYLYRTVAVALMILLAAWYRTDAEGRVTIGILAALAFFLVLSGGYRSHLLVPIGAAIVFRHYYYRRIGVIALLPLVAAAMLFLVGFGAFRMVGGGQELSAEIVRKLFVELQNPAFALHRVREHFPWTYEYFQGLYLFRGFLALLPGEQISIGLILKEMLGLHYAGGGFAPSILGGFYIDFGTQGVVLGMATCGFCLGITYRWMRQNRLFYDALLYAYLLTYLVFSIRGGVLQEVFPLWVLAILLGFRLVFRGGRSGMAKQSAA